MSIRNSGRPFRRASAAATSARPSTYPGALARVKSLPEQAVEERAGRTGLVRRAHLAEDLGLARYHRVETGGDAEEVERRRLVLDAVQHRPQCILGETGGRGERLDGASVR